MIGADSKAVKRVLDGVSKAAPGLSFMGFSAEGPGASGKLIVFSAVTGAAAEVRGFQFADGKKKNQLFSLSSCVSCKNCEHMLSRTYCI